MSLTPEQIHKMSAGPEMNAAVAVDVLNKIPCDGWVVIYGGRLAGQCHEKKCDHDDDACFPAKAPSDYSGNIAAARAEVERLLHKIDCGADHQVGSRCLEQKSPDLKCESGQVHLWMRRYARSQSSNVRLRAALQRVGEAVKAETVRWLRFQAGLLSNPSSKADYEHAANIADSIDIAAIVAASAEVKE